MKCNFCGAECPDDSTYCDQCGSVLDKGASNTNNQNFVKEESVSTESTESTVPTEPVVPRVVMTEDPGKNNGMIGMILGIAALVIGPILSCICFCLGSIFPIGLAVGGIVVSKMAEKTSKEAGFENKNAKYGFILSIAAIAVSIIVPILYFVFSFILGLGSLGIMESLYSY